MPNASSRTARNCSRRRPWWPPTCSLPSDHQVWITYYITITMNNTSISTLHTNKITSLPRHCCDGLSPRYYFSSTILPASPWPPSPATPTSRTLATILPSSLPDPIRCWGRLLWTFWCPQGPWPPLLPPSRASAWVSSFSDCISIWLAFVPSPTGSQAFSFLPLQTPGWPVGTFPVWAVGCVQWG